MPVSGKLRRSRHGLPTSGLLTATSKTIWFRPQSCISSQAEYPFRHRSREKGYFMLAEVSIDYIAVLSRCIHIASVIVAVGGMFFLRVILLPAAEETLTDDGHHSLGPVVLMRWARVVHISILVILISGGYNAYVSFPPH